MTRPHDTAPASQARVIVALRAMQAEERLAAAVRMSAEVMALAEAGVRSRHPEYGPDEVRNAVARIALGPRRPEPHGTT
jgi:hypothetical protein